MYCKKSRMQDITVLALDCACITASLVLANYIRNGRLFGSDNARMNFGMLLGVFLTVYLAASLASREAGTKGSIFHRDPLEEMGHVVKGNALMMAGAAVALYFLNLLDAYSRLVFLFFVVIDCGGMFLTHQLWKKILPFFLGKFGEMRKLLVVADENCADGLIQDLKKLGDSSYELDGVILVNRKNTDCLQEIGGVRVVAEEKDLIGYCRTAPLDEVVIAVGGEKKILPQMETLAEMGITIHYHIHVPDLAGARQEELSQFGHFYMATYANRMAPTGQILLKRLLDLCGAVIGCVALLPITAVVGPLIRLESPGPVFFAQERVGRNGRVFKMYKFRSMYADAEERKEELMPRNEMDGLMFKIEDDPRITKVGRFMRKTSLDEFPQFVNILKGDMSLVGIRPPTLDEFGKYSPSHKKRLSFRPGLTGMWQVNGRSDITDFEEIVRMDVEYIEKWSFMLDVKILAKTVGAVLLGSGAR